MRNRKGIQLSVNFIVMLILAIVVFSLGLVFAGKFFHKAETVKGTLSSQTERQIEKLLDTGTPTTIPINTKEIYRNKFDTFGLGVLAQDSGTYTAHKEFVKAFRDDKSTIRQDEVRLTLEFGQESREMKRNEKWKNLIGVDVDPNAIRGTYIYRIWVSYEPAEGVVLPAMAEYDNPLQIIVKVP